MSQITELPAAEKKRTQKNEICWWDQFQEAFRSYKCLYKGSQFSASLCCTYSDHIWSSVSKI